MFKNTAKAIKSERANYYGFDEAPKLLFVWSRLFQSVISQAGSHLLSGKFHTGSCDIYKTEGGCRIEGYGDLVLSDNRCYWDHGSDKGLNKLAGLITTVVLEWDPNSPVDSMLESAAKVIKAPPEELKKAIESSRAGGVFGGNALADFFNWNPFSEAPIDRDYERWCRINISKESPETVKRSYADQDLGKDLLKKMIDRVRKASPGSYLAPMCCSPRRFEDNKLMFWINTGRTTQIDGWKSQDDIETFLNGDGVLVGK